LAKKITTDSYYLEICDGLTEAEVLPSIIFESSKSVDSLLVVADIPIMDSKLIKKISSLGIKVGVLPSISEDAFTRCMSVESDTIHETSTKILSILQNASMVRVEAKNGTNISLPIKNREVYAETGILKKIGQTGYIPSGKVFVSPWDAKSNGIIIFDAYIEQIGVLKNAVKVEVENGIATKISGDGEEAKTLAKILNKHGEEARNVAEFGLGINNKAIISSDFFESEISLGTCYIAFGKNISLGGNVDIPIRLSCVLEKPSIFIDDEYLINNGKYTIN